MAVRTAIQEEVHGAICMCPSESPDTLKSSLSDLNHYFAKNANAFTTSSPPIVLAQQHTPFSDALKLQFLRAESFEIEKTASALTKFMHTVVDLFGSLQALRMDDFTKSEMRAFQKGWIQFLPFRDNVGRRVLAVFPGEGFRKSVSLKLRKKLLLYFLYVAGINDVETQRKGIVMLIWSQYTENTISLSEPMQLDTPMGGTPLEQQEDLFGGLLQEVCPVRVSAVHVCMPPLISGRCLYSCCSQGLSSEDDDNCGLVSWTMNSIVGPKIHACRMKFHRGGSAELRRILMTYGISADQIPVTWSNSIKVNYLKQWLWIRHYIEGGLTTSVVECPSMMDVIFRNRTSAMYHPGNDRFRGLIQLRLQAQLVAMDAQPDEGEQDDDNTDWMEEMINGLIRELREENGRFLMWYNNKGFGVSGWWTELRDEKQIYSKIEYSVMKEFRALRPKEPSGSGKKRRKHSMDD